MEKCPWYNTTIFSKRNGQRFKDYLITARKDRYEFMCYVYEYVKERVSMTDEANSCVGRPMPSTSSEEALYPLGHTTKYIDNWRQWYEVNNQNIIIVNKIKMSELFKTTPKSLPKKAMNIKQHLRQL